MGIRVRVEHRTDYLFDRPVEVFPHTVRLCPPPHTRAPIEDYSFDVYPPDSWVNWRHDAYGNMVARLVFAHRLVRLSFTVGLTADLAVIDPYAVFVDEAAATYPFAYSSAQQQELASYLNPVDGTGARLRAWVHHLGLESGTPTIDLLVTVNHAVSRDIEYIERLEPGVLDPEVTLLAGTGADRDSAWLLVAILRQLGVAARFVSGYLVQLASDDHSDFAALHAWVEAYVPGGGWIGLDTTSGMLATESHIPLAAAPHWRQAGPVEGATGECGVELEYSHTVARI